MKWNWCVQKQILSKFLLSKNTFWIFLPHENANFSIYLLSQKPPIGEKMEERRYLLSKLLKIIRFWNNVFTSRQILNQDYHKLSDFLSTLQNLSFFKSVFLQRVRLWIKIFTSCRFLNWISTWRQNLNRDFYSILDSDEKTVFKNSLTKNFLVCQYTP